MKRLQLCSALHFGPHPQPQYGTSSCYLAACVRVWAVCGRVVGQCGIELLCGSAAGAGAPLPGHDQDLPRGPPGPAGPVVRARPVPRWRLWCGAPQGPSKGMQPSARTLILSVRLVCVLVVCVFHVCPWAAPSYSVYAAALWPSIALVTTKESTATAYGVVTAVQVRRGGVGGLCPFSVAAELRCPVGSRARKASVHIYMACPWSAHVRYWTIVHFLLARGVGGGGLGGGWPRHA